MKKLTLIIFFLGFILVGCKVKPIIIEKYKVTYHENGGSEVEDIEVDADTTITLPTPSRNGFTFIGWNDGNGNILNGE
ncbi:MAG TPA: InlB B-repeat-containing protein, partial [Bacilli bacterium]